MQSNESGLVSSLARSRTFPYALTGALALGASACSTSHDNPTPTSTLDAAADSTADSTGDAGTVDPTACVPANHCVAIAAGTKEADVQNAVASLHSGDTIKFTAGTFTFTNQLTIAGDKITVLGAGMDETIFDFSGQLAGSEGIFASKVNDLRLEGFTVKDTKGNGVKVEGSTGVTFKSVKVYWTGANATLHGGYGLYPVQSKNVLLDGCKASGASDSGLYIGQSDHVVVRNCEASKNVAGIEIENTFSADVHDNDAHDNTGGILVFDLPNLPQLGGHGVRVYNNKIHDNNTPNFAPTGNIVGSVPTGMGSFVMASHDVEVFGNTFTNNHTANFATVSYLVLQLKITDTKYYPYPATVSIHDNTFAGGGSDPDTANQLGLLLSTVKDKFPGKVIPDVVYDGILDPAVTGGPVGNPMQVCMHQTGSHLVVLHLDKMDTATLNLADVMTIDPSGFDCTLAPLPPITFPGL
jgi:parallel beta-helix repeat protein